MASELSQHPTATLKSQKATQTFVVTGSSINIVYFNTINCHSEIQCILELKASNPPPAEVQRESGHVKSYLLLVCPQCSLAIPGLHTCHWKEQSATNNGEGLVTPHTLSCSSLQKETCRLFPDVWSKNRACPSYLVLTQRRFHSRAVPLIHSESSVLLASKWVWAHVGTVPG